VPTETPSRAAASRVVQNDFSIKVVDMPAISKSIDFDGGKCNHILTNYIKFNYILVNLSKDWRKTASDRRSERTGDWADSSANRVRLPRCCANGGLAVLLCLWLVLATCRAAFPCCTVEG
jgi:hypothetical protein